MLYNVHSKGHMCTQDEHTFDVHVDLRVTIRFDSSLNPVELQHVQQSTLQQIENSLNFQDSTGGVTQPSGKTTDVLFARALRLIRREMSHASARVAVLTGTSNGKFSNPLFGSDDQRLVLLTPCSRAKAAERVLECRGKLNCPTKEW